MVAIQNAEYDSGFLSSSVTVAQVLASIPPEYIANALAVTRKHDKRERALPGRVMAYFTLLLGLFMDLPYGEVFRRLQDAFNWLGLEGPEKRPTESAICQARQRLGYEPLKIIYEQVVLGSSPPQSPAAYLNGLLLTAIDGCVFDVEDSDANAIFGYPKGEGGDGAYPQVRSVAVVNFYERTLADIEFGSVVGTSEQSVAECVLSRLRPGTLNLADRLYYSYDAWTSAQATGAELLWRVKKDLKLRPEKILWDGSYLARVYKYEKGKRVAGESKIVRAIDYTLVGGTEKYRLITTLLDPRSAPADELARLYPLRYWTSEGYNKEIKAVLRSPRVVLRSKSPPMVIQELYGMLLAHHAVRMLISQAAEKHSRAPTDISFKNAVHVIRRHLTRARSFSPRAIFSHNP
jgi:hypothetical protein